MKHPVRLLAALAVASGLVMAAHAADPRAARKFVDKPRIEDYADYNSFLVDIMEYRRQKDARGKELAATNAARAQQGLPPQTEEELVRTQQEAAPASPLARDPYSVRRPESLDEALERARYLKHPVYDKALRFDKTTSQSFPLQPLEGEEMSVAELTGTLTDTSTATINEFVDTSATDKARTDTKTDPTDDEDARKAKAAADSYAVTRAGVDPRTGLAIDSAGDRYSLQMATQYTSGEGLDIRVHYLSVDIEAKKIP